MEGMEYAHRDYNHEDEIGGMYVSIDNEGTHSNGYEECKEERMNLVEIIKSMQKYVYSYKVDNERIMKSKEKRKGFNIKLMQILDRIEKKMDKDIEARKSGNHISHDERRRKRMKRRLLGGILKGIFKRNI
jgi:nicotinamide riboside kinase